MDIRVTARQGPPIATTVIDQDLTATSFPKHEPWTNIDAVTLTDVDFRGHTFGPFNALGSTFIRCRFDGVKFRSGTLGGEQQTRYLDCTFEGVRFPAHVWLGNSRFERCAFSRIKINGWRAFEAEFIDCQFSGELRGCWFTGTTERAQYPDPARAVNEFHGNDFTDAKLIDCQFDHGIDLNAQRWPSGPEYLLLDRFHDRVRAARALVARWPDDQARELVLGTLRIMSEGGMEHQDTRFIRRDDWMRYATEAHREMLRLLEADPGS